MTDPRPQDFPLRTTDKLRYGDTDRQGHVNNAVFSTFLETGRVEMVFDADHPLLAPGAAFVIARLELDFKAELRWPGTVEIGTRVQAVGPSSVPLEQAVFQNGVCAALGKTVLVQMDEETRRSKPLEPAALERLRALAGTDAQGRP